AEARARVVILAASALESTRILLNSTSRGFPNGLGNSSGVLGRYLMDHFTLEGAGGIMPALTSSKRQPTGNPCGFLIPKVLNTAGGPVNKNFLRGYRFDGDASQSLYGHAFGIPGFGSDFRRKVSACRGTTTTSSSTRKRRMSGAFPRCASTRATEKTSTAWRRRCARTS